MTLEVVFPFSLTFSLGKLLLLERRRPELSIDASDVSLSRTLWESYGPTLYRGELLTNYECIIGV